MITDLKITYQELGEVEVGSLGGNHGRELKAKVLPTQICSDGNNSLFWEMSQLMVVIAVGRRKSLQL
jgi:hypothetical protein